MTLFTCVRPSRPLGAAVRILFWIAHVGIPLLLLQTMQTLLSGIEPLRRWPWFALITLAGVIGAVVFTPAAVGLDALFGFVAMTSDADEAPVARLAREFLALAPPMVFVWLALNATRCLRAGLQYLRVETVHGNALILYPFG